MTLVKDAWNKTPAEQKEEWKKSTLEKTLQQKILFLHRKRYALMNSAKERKQRTRTLIQLGGLVEKAGLTKLLDITLGEDLTEHTSTPTLLGALQSLSKDIENNPSYFYALGKKSLML